MDNKETVFYNGKIYTADKKGSVAEAFVVRDGRFAAVGGMDIVEGSPEKVDLKGRCVIPGLIDSHCHLFAGVTKAAMNVQNVSKDTRPEELGKALLALDEQNDMLMVMGIDITQGDFSARDIDPYINDRPVLVFSFDSHALLLNSCAMEFLKVDEHTEDPGEQSYFVRDDDGKPTGLVIEIPAIKLCMENIWDVGDDSTAILREICKGYSALGYTTVFDAMSVYGGTDEELAMTGGLSELDSRGELDLRICMSFSYQGGNFMDKEQALEIMKRMREQFSTEHVFPDTLKLITDGTVEEHTALLYGPYADEPVTGSEMLSCEDMEEMAALAASMGFNIHIHAIGDKAADRALDVLCGLGTIKGTKTIAHNQLYSDKAAERIAAAGDIFFQTTPHWVRTDNYTRRFLGEERYRRQFPVGTMVRNGVTVTFGSDSFLDEDTANAFLGMYYAEARGIGACDGICFPPHSEGADRENCLRAYTINGARQLGLAEITGSIEAGKSADFVILDRDIMACTPEELKDTEVEETWFAGREVYSLKNNT